MAGAFHARYRTDQPSPSSISCTVGATRSGVQRGGIADHAEAAGAELSGNPEAAVGGVGVGAPEGYSLGLALPNGGGGGGCAPFAEEDEVGKYAPTPIERGEAAEVEGGVAVIIGVCAS